MSKSKTKNKPAKADQEMTKEDAVVAAFELMIGAIEKHDYAFAHRLLVAIEKGRTGMSPNLATLCEPRPGLAARLLAIGEKVAQ